MPKNKTHSGAKKRFRTTGSGKIMREQAGARHLLEHKSSRIDHQLLARAVFPVTRPYAPLGQRPIQRAAQIASQRPVVIADRNPQTRASS